MTARSRRSCERPEDGDDASGQKNMRSPAEGVAVLIQANYFTGPSPQIALVTQDRQCRLSEPGCLGRQEKQSEQLLDLYELQRSILILHDLADESRQDREENP